MTNRQREVEDALRVFYGVLDDERQGHPIDAMGAAIAGIRRERDEALVALRGVYDMLPRWSCKAMEPDGCPVCVARALLTAQRS